MLFVAEHVPRVNNDLTDALFQEHWFRELAQDANLKPEAMP